MYLHDYKISLLLSKQETVWRRGVVVITTAKTHSSKSELRFCVGLKPARSVSDIHDSEDL